MFDPNETDPVAIRAHEASQKFIGEHPNVPVVDVPTVWPTKMTEAQIAKVCHETNRTYCQMIGDDSQASWEFAPEWQRQSAIDGVKFHIASLERGEKPSPAASHNAWLENKRANGWTYGPTKNVETKQHPCFVPYEDLPLTQRRKDYLFAGIVEALHTAK